MTNTLRRTLDEVLTTNNDPGVVLVALELRTRLAREDDEARDMAQFVRTLVHAVLPGIATGLLAYAAAAYYHHYVGGPDMAGVLGVAAGFIATVALAPTFTPSREDDDAGAPEPPEAPVAPDPGTDSPVVEEPSPA